MPETKINFKDHQLLYSLFCNDLKLLKEMEKVLGISITSRDSWIKLRGDEKYTNVGKVVFEKLEKVKENGTSITPQIFRYILEEIKNKLITKHNVNKEIYDLFEYKLLQNSNKSPITPKTKSQLEYLQKLDKNDIVFGVGAAGTGKTYLAMAYALNLLEKNAIDKIMITRPAVEAGESLGFLPGALEEKVMPYLRPIYDAIYNILDRNEAKKILEDNLIEIAPLAYMRGRTFNRTCIILDEAQNANKDQMFMFLTRIGLESRCIITGDPSQIDLKVKKESGLIEAIEILDSIEGISFTYFTEVDVMRNPIVKNIIKAYKDKR